MVNSIRFVAVLAILLLAGQARAGWELVSEASVGNNTGTLTVPNVTTPGDCDPCLIVVSFAAEDDSARSIGTATWNATTFTEGTLSTQGSGPFNTAHQAWLYGSIAGVTSDVVVTTSGTPIAGVNVSVWKGVSSGTPESNQVKGATIRAISDNVTATEGSIIVEVVSDGLGIVSSLSFPYKRVTALTGYESAGNFAMRAGYASGAAAGTTHVGWGLSTGTAPRLALSTVAFDVTSPDPEVALDLGDPTDDVPITDHGWISMATEGGFLCDGSDEHAKWQPIIDAHSTSTGKALQIPIFIDAPGHDCASSDTINFRRTDTTWINSAAIIGRGRTVDTLRLLDASTGYDDPNAPKPLLQANSRYTPGNPSSWNVSGGGNEAFNNYLMNVKVDTGDNNSGAVGADWHASNTGAIRNVDFVAGAQGGFAGVSTRRELPGPVLFVDSTVTGFNYGYVHTSSQYNTCIERSTFTNQTVAVANLNNAFMGFHKVTSSNTVPLVQGNSSAGLAEVLDSTATGGAGGAAFTGTGTIFIKNFESTGYSTSVNGVTGINVEANTPNITEYHSRAVHANFNIFSQNSIDLPFPDPPTMFTTDNPDAWVNAARYGSSPTSTSGDDALAWQEASGEGYPYIYTSWNGYNFLGTYNIPATTQTVDFMLSNIGLDGSDPNVPVILVEEDSVTPLTIWRMRGNTNAPPGAVIEITAQRPVVIKDVNLGGNSMIKVSDGAGPVWLENVFTGRLVVEEGATVYAQQLNIERSFWDNTAYEELTWANGRVPRVINRGGTLNMYCAKTESARPWSYTDNGGTTQLLGAFIYPVSPLSITTPLIAAHELVESSGFFSYIEEPAENSQDRTYDVHLRETRNGIVRELKRGVLPIRNVVARHATALSGHTTGETTISPNLTFMNADSSTWNVVQIDPDGEEGIVLDPGLWSQPVDCTPYARVAMTVQPIEGSMVDIDLYSCDDIGGPPIGSFDPADPPTLTVPHQCTNLTDDVIVDGVGNAEGTTNRFSFSGHLGQLLIRTQDCEIGCEAIVSMSCSGSNAIAEFEGDALSVRDASKALGDAVNEAIEDGMTVEIQITVPASKTTKFKTIQELGTVKVYRPDYNSSRDGPALEP